MALTDAVVRKAKITDKDYTLTDADGLILFVSGNGAKKWHFRFTWLGKQRCVGARRAGQDCGTVIRSVGFIS